MASKVHTKGRKWLNPVNSYNSGAIQYIVSSDEPWDRGESDISAELSIWDCSRKITLDFSVYTHKDAVNSAKKIQVLQDALQDIKEALSSAYGDYIK